MSSALRGDPQAIHDFAGDVTTWHEYQLQHTRWPHPVWPLELKAAYRQEFVSCLNRASVNHVGKCTDAPCPIASSSSMDPTSEFRAYVIVK